MKDDFESGFDEEIVDDEIKYAKIEFINGSTSHVSNLISYNYEEFKSMVILHIEYDDEGDITEVDIPMRSVLYIEFY